MRVNNNIIALNSRRHLGINSGDLSKRLERLSSGIRINKGSDDPSGLSVSEGMRAQLRGLAVGTKNAEQGTNLIQTAEGALNEVSAMLVRMRELATQSASSTINDTNRLALNAEVTQLVTEIDRIANATTYNNSTLLTGFGNSVSTNVSVSDALVSTTTGLTQVNLSGAEAGTYTFVDTGSSSQITLGNGTVTQTVSTGTALDGTQVATGTTSVVNFDRLGLILVLDDRYSQGDLNSKTVLVSTGTGGEIHVGQGASSDDRLTITIDDMRATGGILNLSTISVGSMSSSRAAISQLNAAIDTVALARGRLGVQQNRLGYTISRNNTTYENLQASESTIRDADVAEEVSYFTRSQILTQTTTSLLAQANALPQNAMTLLQR
jgi:flagellin